MRGKRLYNRGCVNAGTPHYDETIYIDITAALRAVLNIARACACNILYLHEGASPRRRYFRIARRAQRARVLYDCSALEARMISCISMSGRFSSVVVMPLIR